MSRTALLAAVAAIVAVCAHSPAARAETIVIDGQVTVVKSDIPRPTGGMTMQAVEAKFGAPRERHPTVGKPPITRWDYDQFAVFFEKDRVIHAVVTAPATPPPSAAPAAAGPTDAAAPGTRAQPSAPAAGTPPAKAPAPPPLA
ncbi:MAG: hypothetical protein ACRETK_09065 [Steroidobacteraceae bacterium]